MHQTTMKLVSSETSGVVVAAITGRIDHYTSEDFERLLDPLLSACQTGKPPLLLDLSCVDYISSAGLRVLMKASRQVKTQQGSFAVAALQPLVQEVFAISRFNLIIPCYASIDAAVKVLGA